MMKFEIRMLYMNLRMILKEELIKFIHKLYILILIQKIKKGKVNHGIPNLHEKKMVHLIMYYRHLQAEDYLDETDTKEKVKIIF